MTQNNPALIYAREIEIAALFHTITKFQQQTQKKVQQKHSVLEKDFIAAINLPTGIDKLRIQDLILHYHTEGEKIDGVMDIKTSDWISVAMDRESNENAVESYQMANKAIASIFSDIAIDTLPDIAANNTVTQKLYYSPYPLDIGHKASYFGTLNKPTTDQVVKISAKTWEKFIQAMQAVPANMEYAKWMITINAILKKYTFNMLSARWKTKPTVSLYSHLTSTAVLAHSNAYYNQIILQGDQKGGIDDPRHLLIRGDLNGIQRYIFTVHSPEDVRKGTSKRLRGRSFSIQLLTLAIIQTILDKLQLTVNNIITNAAGNFTILTTNTEDIQKILQEIKAEINQKIAMQYDDRLNLTLVWHEFSNKELQDFDQVEQIIADKVAQAKLQKADSFLKKNVDDAAWDSKNTEKFFKPVEVPADSTKCKICERIIPHDTNEVNICEECISNEELGGLLPKSNAILVSKQKLKQNSFAVLDYEYTLIAEQLDKYTDSKDILYIIAIGDENYQKQFGVGVTIGITYQFFGLSLPTVNGIPISFDELAKMSKAFPKLGVLKADVDNLGTIFGSGLSSKGNKKSLASYKDLSNRVDIFFSAFLGEFAKQKDFAAWIQPCSIHKSEFIKVKSNDFTLYRPIKKAPECETCDRGGTLTLVYSIFAGGDDLALVGPWDILIKFISKLNDEFNEYTANNPWFTLSGAIELFDAKSPINKAVEFCEESLEKSKARITVKGFPIKNSVTLFGETVLWDIEHKKYPHHKDEFGSFKELFKFAQQLENLIEKDKTDPEKISRTFTHNLLELWKLGYDEYNSFEELTEHRLTTTSYYPLLAYQLARNYKNIAKEMFELLRTYMPWIKIPLSWAYYRTK